MKIEDIARIAHEANRAYCESLGDTSQVAWDQAPEWQKSSAINGVAYHLANPHATARDSHDNWLKRKTEEGWKYGPKKNPALKEHPCFVPYEQLPIEQRAKDYLFAGVIGALRDLVMEG